nr:MAG TPA: hypothetical protein [Caudoviricetes sp.]
MKDSGNVGLFVNMFLLIYIIDDCCQIQFVT